MSRKIILMKQQLLLLVYEINRSGLLAENEKIRPVFAQHDTHLRCYPTPHTSDLLIETAAGNAATLDGTSQGALTIAGTYQVINNSTTFLNGTITNTGTI